MKEEAESCPEELHLDVRCNARHPHQVSHSAGGRLPNGCHYFLTWWRAGPPDAAEPGPPEGEPGSEPAA